VGVASSLDIIKRSDEPADVIAAPATVHAGKLVAHLGIEFPDPHSAWLRTLVKFTELLFLDRFDALVRRYSACAVGLGAILERQAPDLPTTGRRRLLGLFCSRSCSATEQFTSNSTRARLWTAPLVTGDDSRNSFPLDDGPRGEGWHKQSPPYPAGRANTGFWWGNRHHLLRSQDAGGPLGISGISARCEALLAEDLVETDARTRCFDGEMPISIGTSQSQWRGSRESRTRFKRAQGRRKPHQPESRQRID